MKTAIPVSNQLLSLPKHPILPDSQGFFGAYGGQFIPEILKPNMDELTEAFYAILQDEEFWQQYQIELRDFSGRPTPITFAANLTQALGGAKIYFKREDLN